MEENGYWTSRVIPESHITSTLRMLDDRGVDMSAVLIVPTFRLQGDGEYHIVGQYLINWKEPKEGEKNEKN